MLSLAQSPSAAEASPLPLVTVSPLRYSPWLQPAAEARPALQIPTPQQLQPSQLSPPLLPLSITPPGNQASAVQSPTIHTVSATPDAWSDILHSVVTTSPLRILVSPLFSPQPPPPLSSIPASTADVSTQTSPLSSTQVQPPTGSKSIPALMDIPTRPPPGWRPASNRRRPRRRLRPYWE
ncbi:uncharacterized protein [Ptychodera flava]|uniref:uncharacterized protein n=1 Tax=Ptychodera flava TaxID=63121 RepID=UPI00396A3136